MKDLPEDVDVYKELHALLVELGKACCRAKPNCAPCPLREDCEFGRLHSCRLAIGWKVSADSSRNSKKVDEAFGLEAGRFTE